MSCATCGGSGTMPGFAAGTFPCPSCRKPEALAHSVAVLSSPAPAARAFCEWCPLPPGHEGACLPEPESSGRGDDGESYMVGGSGRRGGRGRE